MSRRKKLPFIIIIIAAALTAAVTPAAVRLYDMPGDIFLTDGSSRVLEFDIPINVEMTSDSVDVLSFNGTSLKDTSTVDLGKPIVISPKESGSTTISFNLFGVIPIKSINVTVGEEVLLYPGGQSIGVMLHTDGALVVGSSYITTSNGEKINPAETAGLMAGDVIKKVNGEVIQSADHLSELINNVSSEDIELEITRGGSLQSVTITPAKDASDGKYRLGVWVRDSTAGVGTLTFYEPATGSFAGLGHAITDTDTGELLSVKNGEIIESRIIEVVKGTQGEPGELKGVFDPMNEVIGHISKNTRFGIYGKADTDITNGVYSQPVVAASRDEVTSGPATICCAVDDRGVKEYECRIVKLQKQSVPEQKSFVIEITDAELLSMTGGIVQGMSGSPVLQNGKIVGAVTHVFVNDPSKGYGIYIDWMLNEIE